MCWQPALSWMPRAQFLQTRPTITPKTYSTRLSAVTRTSFCFALRNRSDGNSFSQRPVIASRPRRDVDELRRLHHQDAVPLTLAHKARISGPQIKCRVWIRFADDA